MDIILQATEIYQKLKFYCEFHGLDFLNLSDTQVISDLVELIDEES